MKISFDGKSGAGFHNQGLAEMTVRTMIERAKAELGMREVVGEDKLSYPSDGKRTFIKGSVSFD